MLSTQSIELLPAIEPTPALRPYQQKFIADVYAQIRAGAKRILGFSATGSGKTLVGAQVLAHAVAKGRRTMFIVHRDILVQQTFSKVSLFGLNNCGFIKSGWQENREALVQIGSVQTMARRDWWHQYPADVIILDEAHLVTYTSVVRQMMNFIYPQAIYLALTATPWRTKKCESLGDIFESLVCAPMPHELIDAGFLVKPSYFSPNQADLDSVGTTVSGDFDEGQLALVCDRPELIQQTVRNWFKLAYGRRTIDFKVNVAHARHQAEAFLAAGVPAAYVDGTVPEKVANQIYQQLATGEILVLCTCMKLVEGCDIPAVSAINLDRPTKSRSLYFQMIGRGLRLSPETGKIDCVVIDSAGNILRHGYVENITNIILSPSKETVGGEAPYKVCPAEHGGCSAVLFGFQMKCPKCGYAFPQPKKIYLVPELEQCLCEEDIERYEFYRKKLREAYNNNFDPGWAAHVFREKYGHWSPESWSKGAILGAHPTKPQLDSYRSYLTVIAERKEKPQMWVQRYMGLEFGFGFERAA